ncbi:MAG: hypothetical protein GY909_12840 [Oligoflexia bacterium]|nr:hypothetical protein [Oligoflexia bacterium]
MTQKNISASDLDHWLFQNVGYENFKSGRERLDKAYAQILKRIKNSKTKVAIIAGTNGKGETSWKIAKHLYSSGSTVALWTSPHVESVTERFWKNGEHPSNEELMNIFQSTAPQDLTFYEYLFLSFLNWAIDSELEFLVLEVGLGGRLDATNLIDADISAVVSIGRDHVDILGHKLEDILYEKLGVTREGTPLVSGITQEHLKKKRDDLMREKNVSIVDIDEKFGQKELEYYPYRNSAIAQLICSYLQSGSFEQDEELSFKFRDITAPNRFEKMTLNNRSFIFIGAHNLDGVRETCKLLRHESYNSLNLLLGFSKRDPNDVLKMVKSFLEYPCLFEKVNFFDYEHPRSIEKEELEQILEKIETDESSKNLQFNKDIKCIDKFFSSTSEFPQNETYLICGSYYFIGEVKKFLSRH